MVEKYLKRYLIILIIYITLMKQFVASGTSHPILAQLLSNHLDIPLCHQDIKLFNNSEIGVNIHSNIRNSDIFLVQTGWWDKENNKSINDFIMETLILIDAYKRSAVSSITLVIPHFPYARQDKKDESRSPITAKLMANLLEKAGVTRVVIIDLHAPQIQGFFDIPVDNIYSVHIFNDYFTTIRNDDLDYLIISPDVGGMKRAIKFGKILNVPVTMMYKQRDYSKISTIDSMGIVGDLSLLQNKTAIICDDMCDTGGTLIQCINILEGYGVNEVICFITHGIFSEPALKRITECNILSKMVVLNTIPQINNIITCDKIIELDCSLLLSKVLRCLNTGDSISDLFSLCNNVKS
jgi:ribose-phosphate pyrophosphokinase